MEAKTLNKVGYSSPSAAWTGIIPARTTTNSEMQQPAPILSSEDRQRTTFFCSFYEDCFFSPLILLFMFIDKLLAVSDGKSTMATSQNTAQFKRWLVGVSSPPAALTGRSAFEGKVVMCHCGLWTEMLLSQPDFEIALDNVCAKFYFVYICQCSQNNPVLHCILSLCCATLPFTIIVIISLKRGSAEPQSIDHYESTA